MKAIIVLLVVLVVLGIRGGGVSGADLSILRLDRGGQLSWTSPSSEAIYSLEAAQSPQGPWFPTYFWTRDYSMACLTLTNATTAWVLTNSALRNRFYQLVWANATNSFRYTGYDLAGNTVVTGSLALVFYPNTNTVSGTWKLQRADNGTNYIGPQIGDGPLWGLRDQNVVQLWWPYGGTIRLRGNLSGSYAAGRLVYTNYSGTWGVPSELPPYSVASGSFRAESARK